MSDDPTKPTGPETPEPSPSDAEGAEGNNAAAAEDASDEIRPAEATIDVTANAPTEEDVPAPADESGEATAAESTKPEPAASASPSPESPESTASESAEASGEEAIAETAEAETAAETEATATLEMLADVSESSASPDAEPSMTAASEATTQTTSDQGGASRFVFGTLQIVLKASTVWTLKTLIKGLNGTVKLLESAKTAASNRESSPSGGEIVERLWVTVQPVLTFVGLTLARSLNSAFTWVLRRIDAEAVPDPEAQTADESPSPLASAFGFLWRVLAPLLRQLWRLWQRLLALVRDRFFPDVLKPLSDATLTVFMVGLVGGLFWGISALTTPSVAEVSPDQEAPPPTESPEPPTGSTPTPQPDRLTDIQEQVSALTERYAAGLVQSVEADFQDDRLTVALGSAWYRLTAPQQDQLASDLLKRSQRLKFEHLEVLDADGTRLARSPVVGSTMIIFKRTSDLPLEQDEVVDQAETDATDPSASTPSEAE